MVTCASKYPTVAARYTLLAVNSWQAWQSSLFTPVNRRVYLDLPLESCRSGQKAGAAEKENKGGGFRDWNTI